MTKPELRTLTVVTVLALCAWLTACGGSPYTFPTGTIGSANIAATQNPLVAAYTVTTALGCNGQVMVEFGTDTSYGRNTQWLSTSASLQKSTILVAGMQASTTYHMLPVAQCPGISSLFYGTDSTFTTGPLPALNFPTLTVTRPNPSSTSPENPGIEMMTLVETNTPIFFTDRDANPIWFYDVGQGNAPVVFKNLPNGNFVVVITLNTGQTVLRQIDLAGNTVHEMNIPTLDEKMQAAGYDFIPIGYHHDVLPLANGHIIILTNFTKDYTNLAGYPGTTAVIGDGLIDLDQNWNPVWAWNSFDNLDVNRHLGGLPDWTHSNAIVYSPADGNLLLSMRAQSWVLKIDYNNGAGSGNVLWHLGYEGDFALTNGGTPTADPSQWFSFQHFPSLISQNGSQTTLAIWDNGDYRPLDASGDLCSVSPVTGTFCYSRATIFQVDESSMVANLLWADPLQYFGLWGGSINQLANGNVEFDLNDPVLAPGPEVASQVEEVTQTSSPQVVWQMDISPYTNYAYRAYRVPSLYPGVAWQY